MEIETRTYVNFFGMVAALLLSASSYAAETYDVKITFNEAGCPTAVDKDLVDLSKAEEDKVQWIATRGGADVEDVDFQVIFGPFKGSLMTAKRGKVTSKKVHKDIPVGVTLKYTIFGNACPNAPLDPRIKVF
jgi:hypothetical protein